VAAPFREVYRNAVVYRAGVQLLAGASWTVQSVLAAGVGLTMACFGVVLVRHAFGQDTTIFLFGLLLVGLGAAGLYLPIETWRKATAPIARARRYIREGRPLATVEGIASMSRETLRVADRSFDLQATATGAIGLRLDGTYVRITYVPDSGLLAIVEVQG
jgi:hypothetical protein